MTTDERINLAIAESKKTKSADPLAHLAWLVEGLELWHRSNGKHGHSPDDCKRFVISSAAHLLAKETAKARINEVEQMKAAGLMGANKPSALYEYAKERLGRLQTTNKQED